jgi:hypothetical protein
MIFCGQSPRQVAHEESAMSTDSNARAMHAKTGALDFGAIGLRVLGALSALFAPPCRNVQVPVRTEHRAGQRPVSRLMPQAPTPERKRD